MLSYYTNKPLYYDITVDLLETPNDLKTFSDGSLDFTVKRLTTAPENQNSEEVSNPLDNYRQTSNESLIVENSVFDIAQGEGKET